MKKIIKKRKKKIKQNVMLASAIMQDQIQALCIIIMYFSQTRRVIACLSFVFFARYYFGLKLSLAQVRWAKTLLKSKYGCVLAPRVHGKTELIAKILIMWLICKNRDVRILLMSLSDPMATKSMRLIKLELETNKKLIRDFGVFYQHSNYWKEKLIHVKRSIRSKDPTVEAAGINSAVTGGHFDYIILDDIIDSKSVQEEKQRKKIESTLETDIMPLLEPTGQIWAIGTRKHLADIYGYMLKNPLWTCIEDKAIIREPEDYEVIELDEPKIEIIEDKEIHIYVDVRIHGEDKGECLWPERVTMEYLLALKYSISSVSFNREYQNIVVSDEFAIFKIEHLKACRDRNVSYIDGTMNESERANVYALGQGVDPAIVTDKYTAERRDTSFMVDITMSINEKGNIRLLNIFRNRGLTPAQVSAIIQKLYHQFEPDACAIESNSFGEFHIRNLIDETELKIVSHHTGKNKHDPFEGVSSLEMLFEHEKIKLPYKTPDDKIKTDCLINELHSFGSGGEHTDQVMAMWIAYRLMLRLLISKRNTNAMLNGKRATTKRRKAMRQ